MPITDRMAILGPLLRLASSPAGTNPGASSLAPLSRRGRTALGN